LIEKNYCFAPNAKVKVWTMICITLRKLKEEKSMGIYMRILKSHNRCIF